MSRRRRFRPIPVLADGRNALITPRAAASAGGVLLGKQGRYRRIDAAGEAADHALAANLLANLLYRLVNGRIGRPAWLAATNAEEEVLYHGLARRRMRDFRVKLQSDHSLRAGRSRDAVAFSTRQRLEARGHP